MKIRLWINGVRFLIEQCEGVAEIRRERDPKSSAAPEITDYVSRPGFFGGAQDPPRAVELKVENVD